MKPLDIDCVNISPPWGFLAKTCSCLHFWLDSVPMKTDATVQSGGMKRFQPGLDFHCIATKTNTGLSFRHLALVCWWCEALFSVCCLQGEFDLDWCIRYSSVLDALDCFIYCQNRKLMLKIRYGSALHVQSMCRAEHTLNIYIHNVTKGLYFK